jgi:hypothetical protein
MPTPIITSLRFSDALRRASVFDGFAGGGGGVVIASLEYSGDRHDHPRTSDDQEVEHDLRYGFDCGLNE